MTPKTNLPHGGNIRELAEAACCNPSELLDFSSNLNAFGPPDWLRRTISWSMAKIVEYPDPSYLKLCEAAALRYKAVGEGDDLASNNFLPGNGSVELIYALAGLHGFRRAIVLAPSFQGYTRACAAKGLICEPVSLDAEDGFAFHPEKIDAALKKVNEPSLVFLGQPNNPTGRLIDRDTIIQLAEDNSRSIFVVDEAFGDFIKDFRTLIGVNLANVVVLNSLTKVFACPGIRLGLAYADPHLLEEIAEIIPPWTVNVIAQEVGLKALGDSEFIKSTREKVVEERTFLFDSLREFSEFTIFPSETNFFLGRINVPGLTSKTLTRKLLVEKRLAIRDCSNFLGLSNKYFRISVRKKEENELLLEAIGEILEHKRPAAIKPAQPKAVMIMGTGSGVGKTAISTAFCRILRDNGYKVAPFKAESISKCSVKLDGDLEISGTQCIQALACGIDPRAEMNPVLLNPDSSKAWEVIVLGKSIGRLSAREYFAYKKKNLKEVVGKAYDELAKEADVIILEGGGSPTEINLAAYDIVNTFMARHAKAKVIMVTDVNKGGAFAALFGTMSLLSEADRRQICGFILNCFQGDLQLLSDISDILYDLTACRILGSLPFRPDIAFAPGPETEAEKGPAFLFEKQSDFSAWKDSPDSLSLLEININKLAEMVKANLDTPKIFAELLSGSEKSKNQVCP